MAFGIDIGAPVNTVLILVIAYYSQKILFPSTAQPNAKEIPDDFRKGYSWMPKTHPPTLLFKSYTPKTLAPFDGKDGGRILLAIKGKVFDVTAGRSFYGPGKCCSGLRGRSLTMGLDGPYGNFAGRDASRGMAKQSFDEGESWVMV